MVKTRNNSNKNKNNDGRRDDDDDDNDDATTTNTTKKIAYRKVHLFLRCHANIVDDGKGELLPPNTRNEKQKNKAQQAKDASMGI